MRFPQNSEPSCGVRAIHIDIDIDIDIYFRIVFNHVVDIFYHFTENDPRAIIGKPVFMTDLSVYFYMLM